MANKNIIEISDIINFANTLARSIRTRLVWSSKLRKAVRVETAQNRQGEIQVKITVGKGNKDLQGMARAFEKGSGIHGKFKRKYRIPSIKNPNPPPFLQFEGTNEFAGRIIRTPEVQHPGVRARPYIRPAVADVKQRAREELKLSIRQNIVRDMSIVIKEINA